MTSRERVKRCLTYTNPDRCPMSFPAPLSARLLRSRNNRPTPNGSHIEPGSSRTASSGKTNGTTYGSACPIQAAAK